MKPWQDLQYQPCVSYCESGPNQVRKHPLNLKAVNRLLCPWTYLVLLSFLYSKGLELGAIVSNSLSPLPSCMYNSYQY